MEKQGFTADKTSFSLFTTQRYDTPNRHLHPVASSQTNPKKDAQPCAINSPNHLIIWKKSITFELEELKYNGKIQI